MMIMSKVEELDKALVELDPVEKEGWQVKSKSDADLAMDKVAEAREKMAENEEVAKCKIELLQKKIDECKNWLVKANKEHEDTIERMKAKLEPWVLEQLYSDSNKKKDGSMKTKSISFVGGRTGITSTSVTEKDEKAILKYLQDDKFGTFDSCITNVPKLNLTALKELCEIQFDENGVGVLVVKETSEVIPSYKVVTGTKFYV